MNKVNFHRGEIIEKFLPSYPGGRGAEIGTFQGAFSKYILEKWNGTLYMIDVWDAIEGYIDISNHANFDNKVYLDAMNSIEGMEDRGIMIRSTSEKASQIFSDGSLDFVYIDANHSYDYVVQDLQLWYPKVKSGGLVMGHDYLDMNWYEDPNIMENGKDKHIFGTSGYMGIFGVNPAVDEFCKANNYDFNVTNEWFGSWYFIKR
jgi:predicted O-methyltransferase YrrM